MSRRGAPDWYADLTLALSALGAALGFAVLRAVDRPRDLAEEVLRQRDVTRFAAHPELHGPARVVQVFGSGPFQAVVVLVVAGALLARRHRSRAAIVVGGGACVAVVVVVTKATLTYPQVDREFGLAVGSFPSGHTAGVTAVLGLVLVTLVPIRLRLLAYAAALGTGLAVAGSRVISGTHTPDDVAAGWLLGAALVLLAGTWLAAHETTASEGDPQQRVNEGGDLLRG